MLFEDIDPAEWGTWPAETVWYKSPYPDDPSVLIEILALDIRDRPEAASFAVAGGWWQLGLADYDNVADALSEVHLLQTELGLTVKHGVVSVRLIQESYPREWHKMPSLPGLVPGQGWPEETVRLGDCLECKGTGACSDCDGRDWGNSRMSPEPGDPICGCLRTGRCDICEGTGLMPAAGQWVHSMVCKISRSEWIEGMRDVPGYFKKGEFIATRPSQD